VPSPLEFADLKALLDLEKASLSDYPSLALLVESVHDAVENYTNRALQEQDALTETQRMTRSTSMVDLRALPIASVASVTVEGDAADYRVTAWGVELTAEAPYAAEVAVTYTGGFEEYPADVYRAELMQTAYEYQNKDNIGAESVSTEGGFVQRPSLQLLAEVRRLLDPYCAPRGFI
jgi:hypothetical protein